jgi:hypothetical protein
MKPAEAAKTAPELQEQTSRGHGIAAAASLFLAVLAALSGDIAMAGVAVVARLMTKDVFLQWALAASAITLGSFLIFGLPQIYAWRRTTTPNRPTLDARTAGCADTQPWPGSAVRARQRHRRPLGDRLVLRTQTPSTGGVLHRTVFHIPGDPLGCVLPRGHSRAVAGWPHEEPAMDRDCHSMIDRISRRPQFGN